MGCSDTECRCHNSVEVNKGGRAHCTKCSVADYTPEELAEIYADREYWEELSTLLGWRLMGFSYRRHASYYTAEGNYAPTLQLLGSQRDTIVKAIRKGA